MTDIHDLRHVGLRMRIVAIGAAYAVNVMRRGMPCHGRSAFVALQAKVFPAFLFDLAVRIVAGCAIKSVGTADLVRAGYLLQFALIAMASVANARSNRAQIMRCPAERGHILRRLDIALARILHSIV